MNTFSPPCDGLFVVISFPTRDRKSDADRNPPRLFSVTNTRSDLLLCWKTPWSLNASRACYPASTRLEAYHEFMRTSVLMMSPSFICGWIKAGWHMDANPGRPVELPTWQPAPYPAVVHLLYNTVPIHAAPNKVPPSWVILRSWCLRAFPADLWRIRTLCFIWANKAGTEHSRVRLPSDLSSDKDQQSFKNRLCCHSETLLCVGSLLVSVVRAVLADPIRCRQKHKPFGDQSSSPHDSPAPKGGNLMTIYFSP